MKRSLNIISLLTLIAFMLSGCQVIGDIFKAGVWVGVLICIAIIAIVVFFIFK